MTELNLRPAVRALVLDHDDRVLLIKERYRDWTGWLTPGGGIDDGEDDFTALHRELLEETGLTGATIGAPLWTRRIINRRLNWSYDGQEETVYLVRCEAFTLEPSMTVEELRAEGVVDHRWWTVNELAATDEQIRPTNMASRVQRLLTEGPPASPDFIEEVIS